MIAVVLSAFILWLAAQHHLDLYVNPRYIWFAVVMAAVALLLGVVSVVLPDLGHDHDDDYDGHRHDDGARHPTRRIRRWPMVSGIGTLAVVAMLAAAQPTTLSASQAVTRGEASGGTTLAQTMTGDIATVGAGPESFTMSDWASTMQLRGDLSFYDGHSATFSGFVTPDRQDPDNVMLVTRFMVTCCTLDAQPVSIPVYRPGWQTTYPAQSWVEGSGGFAVNASRSSPYAVVFAPTDLHSIEEPGDPYLN
ncbi:TIGR03943 family putative permease subunit [Pseudoclavibacter sp. 13-3]|uniref:TIGR03943 family putative permease subunit n=1 Tax=Pseudoclavibacter sp. 13-3 TaxID=2901228 RepID=UPI001E556D4C|nr:TIGR03943 family protein [Pseudoclavibacter sp. 13-3]